MLNPSQRLDLYLAHRSALVDYATPIVGSRSQAEDVVQDAWLRFSTSSPQTAVRQPVNYLYRIVRNLALDLTRSMASEHRQPDAELALAELADAKPSPENRTSDLEALQVIADALGELPERTRRAFELHRFGDCTFAQIAHELGISVGLAHSLVRNALTHCMERLEHEA